MVKRSTNWERDEVISAVDLGRVYSRELSIGTVYRQVGDAVFGNDELLRKGRTEVPARTRYEYKQRGKSDADNLLGEFGKDHHDQEQFYRVDETGTYIVQFAETLSVPDNHVGYVAPKESLVSIGVRMDGTFVGPDESSTGAHLYIEDKAVMLSENAEIAELVVWVPGTEE